MSTLMLEYHKRSDHGRDGAALDSFICNCRELFAAHNRRIRMAQTIDRTVGDWRFVQADTLGCGYLYLDPGVLRHTVSVTDAIHVDVSEEGAIMGVEILNLRHKAEA